MPKSSYRPYSPNPEFLKLLPKGYSGNRINGLNEAEVRRPTMVWWTPDMDNAEFGAAQKWFYEHEEPDEEMLQLRALRQRAVGQPLPERAKQRVEQSPEEWSAGLDNFVQSGDCEMTGVARLRQDWRPRIAVA